MTPRTRLRRIETAMGIRSREPESLEQMSDDELAQIIGGPGCKAASLTDKALEAIIAED